MTTTTLIKHSNLLTENFKQLLKLILASNELHAKWLNTLSYLENCGARKIAACEHPTLVKEEMLKHAAEEFRHAHHLKCQLDKVNPYPMPTYSLAHILGGKVTWHYLTLLDLKTARYLRNFGYNSARIRELAYLLVTYAIELRAGELYGIYDELLKKAGSKVTVKSILLEEKEHLKEMKEGLKKWPLGFKQAEEICKIENSLFKQWLIALSHTIY